MKHVTYCAIAGILGVLVWGALSLWPLTSDVARPGSVAPGGRWMQHLPAFVLAAIVTAIAFRPAIRRMDGPWQVLFVSTLFVLAGSVLTGALIVLLPWSNDLVTSGTTDATPSMLASGAAFAGIVGLTLGVGFLPVGIPLGLGGALALRRIAGRVASA